MENLTKDVLIKLFHQANDEGKDIQIELTVPGSEISEIIITKNGNLRTKLDYYMANYNNDLALLRNIEIKMLSIKIIEWKD